MPKLVDSCCGYIAITFKKATDKELEDKYGLNLDITAEEEE